MSITTETPVRYPAHFESDVVLRNGRTLRLRPVRPDDREPLLAFYTALSADSLYYRFFDVRSPESALEYTPVDVDYVRDFGVIGEIGAEIVGVAHYLSYSSNPKVAEVAFAIADKVQGCGIGTHLLQKLAEVARTNGIERFRAETMTENQRMLDVFLCSGFDVTSRTAEGTVQVSFAIEPTARWADQTAARSQKAAYASMKAIFEPRSIAIVGASRRRGALGTEILANLKATGFRGQLFAVNPNANEIDGVPAYPSLAAIPATVDLVIIAVPANDVEQIVDDCAAKNVLGIVVITAGFGETGAAGKEIERRLLEKVRAAGIRMVGPNCMGVINTDPAVNMHATFAPVFPPIGNVAMSSQSGALGLAILDYARSLNIGLSTFISVGNKTDVSGNDLIQYWAEDPNTDVMLLYLESFGNPRRFGELARRIGRRKPIVAVKAGRSAAGARAAKSHTGALATSDAIVTDLFRQSGVIRTETLEELFDVASLLANQPLPSGSRVAIMTNAGGPGILAADACSANGLELAALSPSTTEKLRALLPPAASVGNPVDMIASASPEAYRDTLNLLLADPNVDSVIIIYIPVLPTHVSDVALAIRSASHQAKKTLVATFMSARGLPSSLAPVPSFPFPERAVTALARATRYAEWRRKPAGVVTKFEDFDELTIRRIVERTTSSQPVGGWLDPVSTVDLLRAAGIPVAPTHVVTSAADAMDIAEQIGFPVVLKACGERLLHKSDVGGVALDLRDAAEVRSAFRDMKAHLGDVMSGAVVQKMIAGGAEMMVGAVADATFGHVIVAGAGGTLVELIADTSFRVQPITDVDAEAMIDEIRCSKLLRGFRGAPPGDEAALRQILMRVSALIDVCPELRELDINPVKVLERGAIAVDARARVEAIVPGPPSRRIAY